MMKYYFLSRTITFSFWFTLSKIQQYQNFKQLLNYIVCYWSLLLTIVFVYIYFHMECTQQVILPHPHHRSAQLRTFHHHCYFPIQQHTFLTNLCIHFYFYRNLMYLLQPSSSFWSFGHIEIGKILLELFCFYKLDLVLLVTTIQFYES